MNSGTYNLIEKFINNLTNESYPDMLYHFTNEETLLQILKSNTLLGADVNNHQVSFTSDETYASSGFQPQERVTSVLVFDANKLSRDYDIKRFIYGETKRDKEDYINEHEWVIENKVNNIIDYLLFIGDNGISSLQLENINKLFPNINIEKW